MEDVKDLDVNVLITDILMDLEKIRESLFGISDDLILKDACDRVINKIDAVENGDCEG